METPWNWGLLPWNCPAKAKIIFYSVPIHVSVTWILLKKNNLNGVGSFLWLGSWAGWKQFEMKWKDIPDFYFLTYLLDLK